MLNENPLISIIIPAFNRANLISETLDSVLNQTYSNWECIIVDDGSEDDTLSIINNFGVRDNRFRISQRNRLPKGAPTCRNIGLEKSKGDYLIFLDSDDILSITCLEKRIKFRNSNKNYDFWVFKTGLFITRPGDIVAVWNILHKDVDDLQRFILQDMPWHTMGPLWSKKTLIELGGFDENAICWQDWELHIRALLKNYKYLKSSDNVNDSNYRYDMSNKTNTISSFHDHLQHILFRTNLFNDIFYKVTTIDKRKEIRDAFGVLFFRLFIELYNHQKNIHLLKLYNLVKRKRIFNFEELILLKLLTIRFKNKNLENKKFNFINNLLLKLNIDKFNNKVNSTLKK